MLEREIEEKGTPISRSQVKAKSPLALQLLTAGFSFISTCLVEPVEPVSSSLATTESCLTPMWIKRSRYSLHHPGSQLPQRNVGAANVSKTCHRTVARAKTRPVPAGSLGRRPGYNIRRR